MTWALQWQPQGKIGWHDTQIEPPNHALTLPYVHIQARFLQCMVLPHLNTHGLECEESCQWSFHGVYPLVHDSIPMHQIMFEVVMLNVSSMNWA